MNLTKVFISEDYTKIKQIIRFRFPCVIQASYRLAGILILLEIV